jgi:hypothetical protein
MWTATISMAYRRHYRKFRPSWTIPKWKRHRTKENEAGHPIDDYEQAFTAPKIMNVTGNADETYSNDAMSTSDHDLSIWEEEPSANEAGDTTEPDEPLLRVKKETSVSIFRLVRR